MKKLNPKYKGTIWKVSKFPKEIKFDDLTDADIPILEHLHLNNLIMYVCDGCEKTKCECNKKKKVKK